MPALSRLRPDPVETVVLVVVGALLAATGLVLGVRYARAAAGPVATAAGGWRLTRTHDGLQTHYPFTELIPHRVLRDSFEFDGSAARGNAFVRATAGGLKVGVRDTPALDYRGWFAVPLAAFPSSGVYHVHMARPARVVSRPGKDGEAVFAVQTASTKITGRIDFVEVANVSADGTASWRVSYSHGELAGAKTNLYWRSPRSRRAPPGRDITVRTDGHRSLTVWLDHRKVFASRHLDMHIGAPFQPYLEVQAKQVPYTATFTHFWVTGSSALTVTGLRPGTRVALRASRGSPLAAATAGHAGTAALHLPPPAAHGRGTLTVTPPRGATHRLGPFAYSGGDHYRVRRLR
jgi:hypothetical protein